MKFTVTNQQGAERVFSYLTSLISATLNRSQCAFVVDIKKQESQRSASQNARYWAILNCIAEETGEEANKLHAYFKQRYLAKPAIEVFGEAVMDIPTTTKLTTKQFVSYNDMITAFASSELGIQIPNLADEYYTEFIESYNIADKTFSIDK